MKWKLALERVSVGLLVKEVNTLVVSERSPRMDDEALLSAVAACPSLYDPSHPKHSDRRFIDNQ